MAKRVIVASHRRSGTHLTIDSIVNNFKAFQNNPAINKVTVDHLAPHVTKWNLTPEILDRRIRDTSCVLKTHAHGNIVEFFGTADNAKRKYIETLFGDAKIIYVHRDGRDVMTSQWYYQRQFDDSVKKKSFGEYLRTENEFDRDTYKTSFSRPGYWAFHVNSWINRKNVLAISFDEFTVDYSLTLQKIAKFIEEPLNEDVINTLMFSKQNNGIFKKLKQKLFKNKLQRSSVLFRKGNSGDWKDCFSEEDKLFFDNSSEKLNEKLGYN